jgi:hypothetical protein
MEEIMQTMLKEIFQLLMEAQDDMCASDTDPEGYGEELVRHAEELHKLRDIRTYSEAMMMSGDKGIVVRNENNEEFHITVQKVR